MSHLLADHDPLISLALAIIYQAALDLQNGHPALACDAKIWLQQVGVSWCQILDVPENAIETWSAGEFKLADNPQRNWRY